MPDRRQHSQRDGNDDGQQNGQHRQQKRSGQLGGEGLEYVLPGDIACPHIAGHHPAYPGEVLGQKRLVQPQLRPLRVNDLLGHRAFVAIDLRHGIAARRTHHGKGQKGNADQNRNQLQQPPAGISQHSGTAPFSPPRS